MKSHMASDKLTIPSPFANRREAQAQHSGTHVCRLARPGARLLRDRRGRTLRRPDGDRVHTLTLTDISCGWTECVAMRTRDQMLVIEAFEKVTADLPFEMLGI